MGNTIKQKNVIYGFSRFNGLPYADAEYVNYQGDNANVNSVSLNNTYQQLVDNDLFVNNQLLRKTMEPYGVKSNDEQAVRDGVNGYKFWGTDRGLPAIMHKVDHPMQDSFRSFPFSDVSFIQKIDENKLIVARMSGTYIENIDFDNFKFETELLYDDQSIVITAKTSDQQKYFGAKVGKDYGVYLISAMTEIKEGIGIDKYTATLVIGADSEVTAVSFDTKKNKLVFATTTGVFIYYIGQEEALAKRVYDVDIATGERVTSFQVLDTTKSGLSQNNDTLLISSNKGIFVSSQGNVLTEYVVRPVTFKANDVYAIGQDVYVCGSQGVYSVAGVKLGSISDDMTKAYSAGDVAYIVSSTKKMYRHDVYGISLYADISQQVRGVVTGIFRSNGILLMTTDRGMYFENQPGSGRFTAFDTSEYIDETHYVGYYAITGIETRGVYTVYLFCQHVDGGQIENTIVAYDLIGITSSTDYTKLDGLADLGQTPQWCRVYNIGTSCYQLGYDGRDTIFKRLDGDGQVQFKFVRALGVIATSDIIFVFTDKCAYQLQQNDLTEQAMRYDYGPTCSNMFSSQYVEPTGYTYIRDILGEDGATDGYEFAANFSDGTLRLVSIVSGRIDVTAGVSALDGNKAIFTPDSRKLYTVKSASANKLGLYGVYDQLSSVSDEYGSDNYTVQMLSSAEKLVKGGYNYSESSGTGVCTAYAKRLDGVYSIHTQLTADDHGIAPASKDVQHTGWQDIALPWGMNEYIGGIALNSTTYTLNGYHVAPDQSFPSGTDLDEIYQQASYYNALKYQLATDPAFLNGDSVSKSQNTVEGQLRNITALDSSSSSSSDENDDSGAYYLVDTADFMIETPSRIYISRATLEGKLSWTMQQDNTPGPWSREYSSISESRGIKVINSDAAIAVKTENDKYIVFIAVKSGDKHVLKYFDATYSGTWSFTAVDYYCNSDTPVEFVGFKSFARIDNQQFKVITSTAVYVFSVDPSSESYISMSDYPYSDMTGGYSVPNELDYDSSLYDEYEYRCFAATVAADSTGLKDFIKRTASPGVFVAADSKTIIENPSDEITSNPASVLRTMDTGLTFASGNSVISYKLVLSDDDDETAKKQTFTLPFAVQDFYLNTVDNSQYKLRCYCNSNGKWYIYDSAGIDPEAEQLVYTQEIPGLINVSDMVIDPDEQVETPYILSDGHIKTFLFVSQHYLQSNMSGQVPMPDGLPTGLCTIGSRPGSLYAVTLVNGRHIMYQVDLNVQDVQRQFDSRRITLPNLRYGDDPYKMVFMTDIVDEGNIVGIIANRIPVWMNSTYGITSSSEPAAYSYLAGRYYLLYNTSGFGSILSFNGYKTGDVYFERGNSGIEDDGTTLGKSIRISGNNFLVASDNKLYNYTVEKQDGQLLDWKYWVYESQLNGSGNLRSLTSFTDITGTKYICSDDKYVLSSSNARKWDIMLSVDSESAPTGIIRDLYWYSRHNLMAAKDDKLWYTVYSYDLSNDTPHITEEDAYNIYTENKEEIEYRIGNSVTAHEANEHGVGTQIYRINGCTTSDFEIENITVQSGSTGSDIPATIENDYIETVLTGDQTSGIITARMKNSVTEPTGETGYTDISCQYIAKCWYSGMTELFIHLPTTNTFYVPHVSGAGYCTAAEGENVTVNGKTVKNNVKDNYTEVELYVLSSYFSIQDILENTVKGMSLPLRIYKDAATYGDEEGKASRLYHSVSAPSLAQAFDPSDGAFDSYKFDYYCFGSDEQAIKITFFDKNKNHQKKYKKVIYHGRDGVDPVFGLDTVVQRVLEDDVQKKLFKDVFEASGKEFIGWTTNKSNMTEPDYSEEYVSYDDIQSGALNLYAIWSS